jgi:Lon protease-like protein
VSQKPQISTDEQVSMPIFPLRTVLFPGGVLPLRIFEPRYVDMVRWCMREQASFGVVLLREGGEVIAGADASTADQELFAVGTEAEIFDFNQADNGLLGIVAQGRRKFSLLDVERQRDGLLLGHVQFLPPEPEGELVDEHEPLVAVLKDLLQHPLIQQLNPQVDLAQARSVSYRLADLLPIEPEIKQTLLQIAWPKERLSELRRLVGKFRD